jgi:hypothetical protein
MDERLKFVARILDGDKMALVYPEFGISRKRRRYKAEVIHMYNGVPFACPNAFFGGLQCVD